MINKILKKEINIHKIIFLLLSIFLFFSLLQFNNYNSLAHDENKQLLATHIHLAAGINFLLGNGNEVTNPYGIFQKLPAIIFSIISAIIKNPLLVLSPSKIVQEYQDFYYGYSHFFSVLYGLTTCYLLLDICKTIRLRRYWLAPLILLSSPVFFGHSIFNIKDIPFALFYTLTSWSLLKLFEESSQNREFSNKSILITGILVGLTASLKLVIFPILIFTEIITIFVIKFNSKTRSLDFKKIAKIIFKIILISLIVLFLSLPSSWGHPIDYFINSFNIFKNHFWLDCNFFNGKCIGIESEDWSLFKYLLNWFSLKMTLINIFGFLSSFFILVRLCRNIKNFRFISSRDFVRILFLGQLYIVPFLAILNNSNAYNGIRHFLFVLPPISFFASDSIDVIFKYLRIKLFYKIFNLILIFLISFNIIDIIFLSPYQYVYFNELLRGKMINNTEIDYYRSSIGELYKKSRNKTNLFSRVSTAFLEKINKDPIDEVDGRVIKFNYQARDFINLKNKCTLIDSVERKYPISNTKLTLSSLILCEKGD